jgi:DNA polymerase III epsilon subunit
MREIVMDTETTDSTRWAVIASSRAVELINHSLTGRMFHCYLNPERAMPGDAVAVHGLTAEFLADKPSFGAVADELLTFVGDAPLVAHNAGFDIAFLNAELRRAAKRCKTHIPLAGRFGGKAECPFFYYSYFTLTTLTALTKRCGTGVSAVRAA